MVLVVRSEGRVLVGGRCVGDP